MSTKSSNPLANQAARGEFIRHLLNDIQALELMLERNAIESGITRIGAEQEFCLLTENWRPSKMSQEILTEINDPHFTTELARYNLEINLDPLELKSNCFHETEASLASLLKKGESAANLFNNKILLTGILPTISKTELDLEYMTPAPRYFAMNETIKAHRGEDFELRLRGVDELAVVHNSVLFEACNTSFQIHLQIDPDDFISSYNWAQAIAGPVLGISTNSPLLLGRELWSETRSALFQQSIDTRNSSYALKDQQARVSFGQQWASGSIADIYKNDVAKHKVLLSPEIDENSLEILEAGGVPKLKALCMNNSTIFRWNRPCYGVGGGKAHVRIENRYIPSGPTVLDEMANFAFWVGLMKGRPKEYDTMENMLAFRDAKNNFVKAARHGKESVMHWNGKLISNRDLVLKELLPIAYNGLESSGIDKQDIERYLGVIEARTKGHTGSQWIVNNFRSLRKSLKQDDALLALTKSMYTQQESGNACHEWTSIDSKLDTHEAATQVSHIMSTQIFTVSENDHADLATSIMKWKDIHHVPVEDGSGNLTGLLTWTHMKRHQEKGFATDDQLVTDIMTTQVATVLPETPIKEAIQIMKSNEYGCLPIARDHHLVGIITINDVLPYDKD
jgi:CBS domain-containing protein